MWYRNAFGMPLPWAFLLLVATPVVAALVSVSKYQFVSLGYLLLGLGILAVACLSPLFFMSFLLVVPVLKVVTRMPQGERFSTLFEDVVLIVLVCGFLFVLVRNSKAFEVRLDGHGWFLLGFIGMAFLHIVNPHFVNFEIWFEGFKSLGCGAMLYFVTRLLMQRRERLDRFLLYMQVSAAVVSLYGYIQKFVGLNPFDAAYVNTLGSAYVGGVALRIFSTLNNAFDMAMYLGVAICCGIKFLQFSTKRYERWITLVCLIINIVGITFTLVRGSWVALIAALMVQLVFGISMKTMKRLMIGLLIGAALLMVIPLPEEFVSRFTTIGNVGEDEAVQARLEAWDQIYKAVEDNPFGMGLATTGGKSQFFASKGWIPYVASDNQFMGFLYEMGYPGLFYFVCIMLSSILYGVYRFFTQREKRERDLAVMYVSCQVFFALSFVSNNVLQLFPIYFLYWILLGMQFVEKPLTVELTEAETLKPLG
jgi:O-antigen ligase